MTTSVQIAQRVLAFTPEEFYRPTPDLVRERQRALTLTDFQGLAANAPEVVNVGAAQELPVFLATRQPLARVREVVLADNCMLVGVDLKDGSVRALEAFPASKQQDVPRDQAPRPRPAAAGTLALIRRTEARKVLSLPWARARWGLAFISFDWASNTVPVLLTDQEDEAPPPPEPPPVVSFTAAPAGVGDIVFTGKAVLPAGPPGPPPAEPGAEPPGPVTFIPVTMIVTGMKWKWPVWRTQRVNLPLSAKPGQPVEVPLRLSAFAEHRSEMPSGPYAGFLVVGGVVHGGVPFKL